MCRYACILYVTRKPQNISGTDGCVCMHVFYRSPGNLRTFQVPMYVYVCINAIQVNPETSEHFRYRCMCMYACILYKFTWKPPNISGTDGCVGMHVFYVSSPGNLRAFQVPMYVYVCMYIIGHRKHPNISGTDVCVCMHVFYWSPETSEHFRYRCMCSCDGSFECPPNLTVQICDRPDEIYDPAKATCRQCVIGLNKYSYGMLFLLLKQNNKILLYCFIVNFNSC